MVHTVNVIKMRTRMIFNFGIPIILATEDINKQNRQSRARVLANNVYIIIFN